MKDFLLIFFVSIFGKTSEIIQDSMDNEDIKDLGPVLEPEEIQFSFDSPGWYFTGFLILLILIISFMRWFKHFRKNAYRRAALIEIDKLSISGSEEELSQNFSTLLAILKLVALKAYGRETVASLYGKNWLEFLESKSKDTEFRKFASLISKTTYQNEAPDLEQFKEFRQLSKKWIYAHT